MLLVMNRLKGIAAICGCAVGSLMAPMYANAMEAAIEEVTVTASRAELQVQKTPYAVYSLGSNVLAEDAPRNLPEALTRMPGVNLQKTANGQGSPFIRGFTGYRTLMLIDGVRYNNSVYRDGPSEYFSLIDSQTIAQIDLINGPGSVLYGSDAIGGTLSLNTRAPNYLQEEEGVYLNAEQSFRFASAEHSQLSRTEVDLGDGKTWGLRLGLSLKDFGDAETARLGKQPHTGYDESAYDLRFDAQLSDQWQVQAAHQHLEQDDVWRTHTTIFAQPFLGAASSTTGTTIGSDLRNSKDQARELSYVKFIGSDFGDLLGGSLDIVDQVQLTVSEQHWREEALRIRSNGQLSSEGNSATFKEFAWRFINIVARALVSLGQRPDYNNILKYVTDIEPLFCEYMDWWLPKNAERGWLEDINDLTHEVEKQYRVNPKAAKYSKPRTEALKRYIEQADVSDTIVLGLLSALRYDKTYFDKIVASLLPLLEKLTTGKAAELIAPNYFDANDDRPIFDWMQIIRKKGIVYIGLDSLTDKEVGGVVGNSMLADITSTLGWIYKHGVEHGMLNGKANVLPKIFLHADEINDVMGDEFLPLVNKGGGAGLNITAYTQSRSDIEAKMGSAAKARQVEGNFNNLIMLRVKEKTTAQLLTDQLPEVQIKTLSSVSGANDSSDTSSSVDFTSAIQDHIIKVNVPMLDPSHITSLPKGQAFCLLDGGQLWKVRFPLPVEDETDLPGNIKEMVTEMKKNYHTADSWWE